LTFETQQQIKILGMLVAILALQAILVLSKIGYSVAEFEQTLLFHNKRLSAVLSNIIGEIEQTPIFCNLQLKMLPHTISFQLRFYKINVIHNYMARKYISFGHWKNKLIIVYTYLQRHGQPFTSLTKDWISSHLKVLLQQPRTSNGSFQGSKQLT
jgi:hypothetical protein